MGEGNGQGPSEKSIEVRNLVVFKYDGHDMLTVKVFDETMCHRHYDTDEDDQERAR
jgi:hypothetical protein